ncbi:transporter substrate-binding domain-containing protein [Pseudaquabacterium terrae]|uniref:transporter substrate-binding domain-containing protein n=1 Tax=Pseudaquabacterium terrae TaxID=2732868 RepID=UPI001567387F
MAAAAVWQVVALPAAAERLRIATGELPPYATASRPDQGIALAVIRAAFERVGVEVAYTFLPWGRAQEEARTGRYHGTAHWGRRPDREQDFLLSDNVLTEQWVLLHRAGVALDWQRLDALAPLRIGGVRTYTYTPEFHALAASGALRVDWVPDDLSLLRMLVAGRVDVVPLDRNVACYLLEQHFKPEDWPRIAANPKLITEVFTTHLMLSKRLPDSAARMQRFNRGLAQLRSSGQYQRLVGSIECRAGLAKAAIR